MELEKLPPELRSFQAGRNCKRRLAVNTRSTDDSIWQNKFRLDNHWGKPTDSNFGNRFGSKWPHLDNRSHPPKTA